MLLPAQFLETDNIDPDVVVIVNKIVRYFKRIYITIQHQCFTRTQD